MRYDSHDIPRFSNADMNGEVTISSHGQVGRLEGRCVHVIRHTLVASFFVCMYTR